MRKIYFITSIIVVLASALMESSALFGETSKTVSDLYSTTFTPAGYVFSIWGVIYVLNLMHAFLVIKGSPSSDKTLKNLTIVNFLNVLWVALWHLKLIWVCLIIIFAMLMLLILAYKSIWAKNSGEEPKAKVFISTYLAWVSVATIANTAVILKYFVSVYLPVVGQLFANEVLWSVFMQVIAVILAVTFIVRQKDYIPLAVVAWAIVGIWVGLK